MKQKRALSEITVAACRADAARYVLNAVKKYGLSSEGWEIENAIRNVTSVFLRLAVAQLARRATPTEGRA